MTLSELRQQQEEEITKFNAMRDKAWADLQTRQKAITEAFGGEKGLPGEYRSRFDEQIKDYHEKWATDTGEHFKELHQHHEQQRVKLTGISPAQPQPLTAETKPQAEELSEKQAKMQKIIAQQQAIRKRQQERKRGR